MDPLQASNGHLLLTISSPIIYLQSQPSTDVGVTLITTALPTSVEAHIAAGPCTPLSSTSPLGDALDRVRPPDQSIKRFLFVISIFLHNPSKKRCRQTQT